MFGIKHRPSFISRPPAKRQRPGAVQNLADMWSDHLVARASWTAEVLYRFANAAMYAIKHSPSVKSGTPATLQRPGSDPKLAEMLAERFVALE
jgi:hypothetical protein